MRANTVHALFNWLIGFSTKWLIRITQIEMPSQKFANKSRVRPTRYTSGSTELKGKKSMGRILDPDWRQFEYVPAAKTDLKTSMERYKEMVRGESKGVRPAAQKAGDSGRVNGEISNQQGNGVPGGKFAVIRGKG
jgi:hypothetical protein